MKRKQKKTTARMFKYQFIRQHLKILWQQITLIFMLTLRLKSLLREMTCSLRNRSKPAAKNKEREEEGEREGGGGGEKEK
jgi:hypothetical protein